MKSINSRRKAVIGEIHEWQGGKFKKTPMGWERISEGNLITHNSIIEKLIYELEPRILDSLEKWEEAYELQFERPMTEYDREMSRLTMLADAVNAFERYTKPTDLMSDLRSHPTPKGSFEISAYITRDGKSYPFWTDVIYAGGHNIQKLHFRYLVKTSLPQTGNKTMFIEISEKIKRLSKLEKLNKELEYKESVKRRDIASYELTDSLSDEEILQQNKYYYASGPRPTWEVMIERGTDKNFDYQKEKFEESERKYRQSIIDGARRSADHYRGYIKQHNKEIAKLKEKINQLVSVIK